VRWLSREFACPLRACSLFRNSIGSIFPPLRVSVGGICVFFLGGLVSITTERVGVLMVHIYCETCDGWDSFPVGGSHNCETPANFTSQDEMNARGQFVMSADWSDDSDY